jgi:hypothetical protein
MPASTQVATTAGAALSASAALPTTVDGAGYAALTWTAVKEVTDAGSIGREYNLVEHSPLATRGVQQFKGSYRDGTMTLQLGWAPGDPGQALIETALNSDSYQSFKLLHQNGSTLYFQALVTSAPLNLGSQDQITAKTVNLAIKSGSIVVVHPT